LQTLNPNADTVWPTIGKPGVSKTEIRLVFFEAALTRNKYVSSRTGIPPDDRMLACAGLASPSIVFAIMPEPARLLRQPKGLVELLTMQRQAL
jgi:hypothetical protein